MARTPWAPGAPALAAAAAVVDAVLARGESADAALATQVAGKPTAQRPAVRAIALGTLRWYLRLAPAVDALVTRPAALSGPVRALLVAGAHQIEYSRNAAELTVHACVDAARLLAAPRAAGLVNAVLRRFVSERTVLLARVDTDLPARMAHPPWLVERIRAAWPEQIEAVLAANNARAPMTLRVDLSRTTADEYLSRLAAASIDAQRIQWIDSAITLNRPSAVEQLPGFTEGIVSVQDAGAQLAAPLLDARPGMHVLEVCAAPGGKTGHLLELLGGGADLTAVDIDASRVELISRNLLRLRRTARLCVADARQPETYWDGRPYERILIDAPCSSTGVIRRHPDIKLLRRAADIPALAGAQLAIARAVVRQLAPGGRLVYSTCSVLPEENEQVVAALLGAEPSLTQASGIALAGIAPGALERAQGVQLLPGAEAGSDGFYYACLEKTTTAA
ncbi:MAG TPA: 16S rRNA (cytosine(967)-C(5))-methyltransferase RsmB [Steroidobacteraceae bacterium]|nr:16S rRNA (cytosine(967)-C(5))-methyltransferase RsmB [Steroidobacteraceae bacterium]